MEQSIVGATVSAIVSVVTKELIAASQSKAAKPHNVNQSLMQLCASYKKIKDTALGRLDCRSIPDETLESQCWHDLVMCWYETEDLIDHLTLSHSVKEQDRQSSGKLVPMSGETSNRCSKISSLKKKLDSLGEQFEKLSPKEHVQKSSVPVGNKGLSLQDRTPCVCGTARDMDKEIIIHELTSHKVGVSIVGMDGLGKTTLARIIAIDEAITSHFSLILSASVSGDFEMDDIVDKLVRSHDGVATSTTGNALVFQKLLKGARKALIILDDLSNVTVGEWDTFYCEFLGSHNSIRILTTTRNPNVAKVTRSFKHYLDQLKDEDCIKIIKEKASSSQFINQEVWNKDIKEIANKCMGMPLIASNFGLTLHTETSHDQFQNKMHQLKYKDIWNLVEFKEILPRFSLNVPELPTHLKRCLAYCSLFSSKHIFNRDDLVQLWQVEGFHQDGSQCFDDLLQRSVFHPLDSCSENNPLYKMYGLNFKFAQLLASKIFLRVDEGTNKFSPSIYIRHMSFARTKVDEQLTKHLEGCEGLRTFLLTHQGKPIQQTIDPTFFHKLERLRLLDWSHAIFMVPQQNKGSFKHTIQKYNPFKLPFHSINVFSFKHLRYLDLSGNQELETLPKPINRLRALQVLRLDHCLNLKEIPSDLCELIRLTHLHVNMKKLLCVPPSRGKLTKLEVLSSYKVDKKQGKVSELGHMDHLREICIYGLNMISDKEEARTSRLHEKEKLKKLALEWDDDAVDQSTVASNVLEGLQPHDDLKDLTVRNYNGKRFPTWFSFESKKLVSLRLQNCKYCECLPYLSQLPLLRNLALQSFEMVKTVNRYFCGIRGFPCLQSLEFSDMNNLLRWIELEEGNMPVLQSLKIHSCPNLQSLPSLKHQGCLVNLVIDSAPKLESLPELPLSMNGENVKFVVANCPLVKDRCQEGKDDWEKIKDIKVKKYIF